MRPGGSKEKGNRFERKMAKQIALWYYGDDNALIKSPSSGALATLRGSGIPVGGDIYQVKYHEHAFPFCVELKHHKEFNTEDLIFERKKSRLWKAWDQCKRDAKKAKKIALLIYKQNYGRPISAVEYNTISTSPVTCVTKFCAITPLDNFLKNTYKEIIGRTYNDIHR